MLQLRLASHCGMCYCQGLLDARYRSKDEAGYWVRFGLLQGLHRVLYGKVRTLYKPLVGTYLIGETQILLGGDASAKTDPPGHQTKQHRMELQPRLAGNM